MCIWSHRFASCARRLSRSARLRSRKAAQGREVYRKVVNISSVSGTMGNAGQVNYAAGKMGLIGVHQGVGQGMGRYKVNVNAVAYGYIQTRLTRSLQEAEGTPMRPILPAA